MQQRSPSPCPDCTAASHCIPFQLGIAGGNSGAPEKIEQLSAGEIASHGPAKAVVVKDGLAARFTVFGDGQRLITEILLPGELVNGAELAAGRAPPSLMALSDIDVCVLDRAAFSGPLQNPEVLAKLLASCADHVGRLRELFVTTGRRSAERRVAAFILYLYHRLGERGLVSDDEMPFPLRQQDLADVLGLTQVHVSRMLKLLRDRGALSMSGGSMRIVDMKALARIAQVPFHSSSGGAGT